jgi:formylglycine-generating enzyme required for sulfatase activity
MDVGDVIDNKYRLLRLLGSGGYGKVFEAEHVTLPHRYAFKCLRPDKATKEKALNRFFQEATAATSIGSEHIVKVLDCGLGDTPGSSPYLVMELLDGDPLDGLLRREAPLSPSRVVRMALQVCEALSAAHAKGIVHRDLKPENLFVSQRGGQDWITVLDFGIAKVRGAKTLTVDGEGIGTMLYMAPEQFSKAVEANPCNDIYSLGAILYELLTGEEPGMMGLLLPGRKPRELRPALDQGLEDVVLRAMAFNPADRHQSMQELAKALEPFAKDEVPEGWVLIEPGTFMMGSPKSEAGRWDDEAQHQVTITRPFLLQSTPVTQAQFEQVLGFNPSHFKNAGPQAPVEQVSWYEAVAFCNELSRRQGVEPTYLLRDVKGQPGDKDFRFDVEWRGLDHPGYRLPTEAEWEYACRAGTKTATYNGDLREGLLESEQPNPILDPIAWFSGNSGGRTHPVGELPGNARGLHDMLGNVWEWTWDWYASYGSDSATDPSGPALGSSRVIRGGSWYSYARHCRAAYRDLGPGNRRGSLGFRPVRSRP